MIEVINLTKLYGDFAAVTDLSFTVNPGEVMGLVGPNGAGKTTTLRCLSGIIPPTRGALAAMAGAGVWVLGLLFDRLDLSAETAA
ncbi:MAG: ATP-binding cassette domain-containing protein [Verrucomicrobia bacterium]|nr:ATP-binding cassette domain-containing protein [Verrucomicrobiota bacterium]